MSIREPEHMKELHKIRRKASKMTREEREHHFRKNVAEARAKIKERREKNL